MIKLIISTIFFLSSVFCDEQGYRFINDITANDVTDIEMITDFSQGGFNYTSNFSGRIKTEYLIRKEVIEEWKTRNNTKML